MWYHSLYLGATPLVPSLVMGGLNMAAVHAMQGNVPPNQVAVAEGKQAKKQAKKGPKRTPKPPGHTAAQKKMQQQLLQHQHPQQQPYMQVPPAGMMFGQTTQQQQQQQVLFQQQQQQQQQQQRGLAQAGLQPQQQPRWVVNEVVEFTGVGAPLHRLGTTCAKACSWRCLLTRLRIIC